MSDFYYLIGSYTMIFVFFTYYCGIADPTTSRLSYLLTVRIPHFIRNSILQKLLGERITYFLVNTLMRRLFYVSYLIIVLGSWSVIFALTYPWIDQTPDVSSSHKIGGYIVFVACLSSWHVASSTSPGIITSSNIEQYDNYPYDGLIFLRGRICPTMNIPKLARSKYDRYSRQHISKFDHFCGWLHNPIGEQNYRWFILFLLIHVGMCWYGTYVLTSLFQSEIKKHDLWNQIYFNRFTGEEVNATSWIVFRYLFHRYSIQAGVYFLLIVMSILLTIFFAWHLYIASICGMTTNETVKWKQVQKWYQLELQQYNKNKNNEESNNNNTSSSTMTKNNRQLDIDDDIDVTCTGGSTTTTTTINNADTKVNTTMATKDDDNNNHNHPGPEPKYIYNYGFLQNWNDIIYPRSLRKEALIKIRFSSSSSKEGDKYNKTEQKASSTSSYNNKNHYNKTKSN